MTRRTEILFAFALSWACFAARIPNAHGQVLLPGTQPGEGNLKLFWHLRKKINHHSFPLRDFN